MQTTIIIHNAHVQVLWQQAPEMVVVTDLRNMTKQQPFAGFDGIKEMFDAYSSSFNDQIGYKDTCDFFKPNIQRSTINAPAN